MFVLRPLTGDDAPALAALLSAQPADYMQYFIPFAFDEAAIRPLLSAARADVYMGVYWQDQLAGFFMLRGWDAGYSIPAYGVTIGQAFRGMGLGRVTLETAKAISRLKGASTLMLKVHPDNAPAKHLYESAGFVQVDHDPRNGNLVYHFALGSA